MSSSTEFEFPRAGKIALTNEIMAEFQRDANDLYRHRMVMGCTRDGMSAGIKAIQDQIATDPNAQHEIIDKGQSSKLLAGLLRRL